MFLSRSAVIVLPMLVLAACSQSSLPVARDVINNPDISQEALRGASHWQVLARETTRDVIGCVEGRVVFNYETETNEPMCRQDTRGLAGRPIHLESVDTATPFGRVFHEFMTTALVQAGQRVSLAADGALVVRSRLSVVKRSRQVRNRTVPGTYALLGAGIWVLRNTSQLAKLLAMGAAADAYALTHDDLGAQVIITTSLMDGNQFIMRRTSAYFIDSADFAHYATNAPTADLMAPPKMSETPPPVRTLKVVEE